MRPGDEIFVTGMLRSGTTLLEKLLGQERRISMLSQPFPLLFVEAKRRFLCELGAGADPYPLGHLFGERRYSGDDLRRYLSGWRASRDEVGGLFARMAEYSGQWTRFSPEQLDTALGDITDDCDFPELVSRLLHRLAVRAHVRWFGSKETTCEELLPVLLARGFRCLLIIRDPRDVLASLNHGIGPTIAGEPRPTLFSVRAWRKSVAFALACEGTPGFHWCRYEDLVTDPGRTMSELSARLELGLNGCDFGRLRDVSGAPWRGNSSHRLHEGVTAASIGTFRDVLPAPVSRFIEAACLPELQLVRYETTLTRAAAVHALHEFREPYTTRAGMDNDLATPANAAIEAERLERLTSTEDDDVVAWFISPTARERMRATFRP